MIESRKRDCYMDLLRIVATIMVIFTHVSADSKYSVPLLSSSWMILESISCVSRIAAVIFFMLSGAFNNELSFSKSLRKGIYFIFLFFLSSLFYSAVDSYLYADFSLISLINRMFDFKYHLWFLLAFAGITILAPLFNRLSNESDLFYLSAVLTAFCVVIPSLEFLFYNCEPLKSISSILNGVVSKSLIYFDYYILGKYIYKKRNTFSFNKIIVFSVLIVSYILSILFTFQLSYVFNVCDERACDNFSIFSLLEASCIFLLFITDRKTHFPKVVEKIVPNLLFVYIVHVLFVEFFSRLGFNSLSFGEGIATIFCVSLKSTIVFFVSFLAAIPIVILKKVIMRIWFLLQK